MHTDQRNVQHHGELYQVKSAPSGYKLKKNQKSKIFMQTRYRFYLFIVLLELPEIYDFGYNILRILGLELSLVFY